MPREWENVEAVPLGNVEAFGDVKIKPHLYKRGICFKLGENHRGDRYREALALGYRKATPQDMLGTAKGSWSEDEQAFISGDLILMVLPIERANGAMRWNWEKANTSISKRNIEAQAKAGSKFPQQVKVEELKVDGQEKE